MRALIAAALLAPTLASAQGIVIPRCPPPRPDRTVPVIECLPDNAGIVRTRSEVKVELRDRVLRYEIEERFVNRGHTIGEADYIFPLPKGAAFRDLKLSIDGQMIAGETMNAADARRIYEDIVRRQKDPALVEWMGQGMLRTRIFPFQAGEERRVVVRYEAVAEREGDALRVDYFRGSSPNRAAWQTPAGESRRPEAEAAQTRFRLSYREGGELGDAYSPTHELDVERDGALRQVSVRAGGPDITVLVALRRPLAASVSVLTHAVRGEQGYALITVTPPRELASVRLPRDVVFVLDVSGSMSGRKLDQARAAGRQLLRTLTDRDRFRIVDFSTDVRTFRDEFVFATEANVRAAVRYLDDLEANGSTNIAGALSEALGSWSRDDGSGRSERLPLVLFVTDGAATVGERDPAAIAARAGRMRGEARVFTVGLGADVNVGLIEQLALEGRGTANFLRPDESVERTVELLATRLRHPLITNVRVGTDGNVRLSRVYPTGELDVFAGQDLVLLARYDGSGPATVVVSGRAGGRTVRWTSERNFAGDDRDNAFVPRLWATQRIGWLAAEKRRHGGSAEIDDEIRRLGERFGIPTEFTSYLVLEPGMVAGAPGRDRRRFDPAARAAAPAPAAERFEAARAAAEQRAATSLAAADANMIASSARGPSGVAEVRRAGTRVFQLNEGRWTDVSMRPTLRVFRVKAFSATYFTLLAKIPELREIFAVGDRLLAAGSSVAIEIVNDAPELSDTEVAAVLKGW